MKEVHTVAKMGRPKAESPKKKNVSFRLTEEEYQKLSEYAAKHELTTSTQEQGVLNKHKRYKKVLIFYIRCQKSNTRTPCYIRKELQWQKQEKITEAEPYAKVRANASPT